MSEDGIIGNKTIGAPHAEKVRRKDPSEPSITDSKALVLAFHRNTDRQNTPTYYHLNRVYSMIESFKPEVAKEMGMSEKQIEFMQLCLDKASHVILLHDILEDCQGQSVSKTILSNLGFNKKLLDKIKGDEVVMSSDTLKKLGYSEHIVRSVEILSKTEQESLEQKEDSKLYSKNYIPRIVKESKQAGKVEHFCCLYTKKLDHKDNLSPERSLGLVMKYIDKESKRRMKEVEKTHPNASESEKADMTKLSKEEVDELYNQGVKHFNSKKGGYRDSFKIMQKPFEKLMKELTGVKKSGERQEMFSKPENSLSMFQFQRPENPIDRLGFRR